MTSKLSTLICTPLISTQGWPSLQISLIITMIVTHSIDDQVLEYFSVFIEKKIGMQFEVYAFRGTQGATFLVLCM